MSDKRLLVVDDEADFATFVARVAEKMGFAVEATTDGAAFKIAYARFDPTVIVLDIVMPDTDGIELVGWLVKQASKARIVIVSGSDPNYARAAQALGHDAGALSVVRLAKPISVSDLQSALADTYLQD